MEVKASILKVGFKASQYAVETVELQTEEEFIRSY